MEEHRRKSVSAVVRKSSWAAVYEKEGSGSRGLPQGRELLRSFLCETETSPLKAWFGHFDRNVNGRVNFDEFKAAITRLQFPGGRADGLWSELDPEESGEITLEEICEEQAYLWSNFKRWCGAHFESARDMIIQLKQAVQPLSMKRPTEGGKFAGPEDQVRAKELVTLEEWKLGLQRCGWDTGSEDLLFEALDVQDEGVIACRELQWLAGAVHRHKMKEKAKCAANHERQKRAGARQLGRAMLENFKAFIAHCIGPTYHAWRRVLDPDCSMTLPRADLFKVCSQLNWKGDIRALWRALDFDGSGSTTLEELDPQCAQLLAQFKDWAERTFGTKPSSAMWRELDKRRKRKLTYPQFMHECQVHGFEGKLKTLVVWLDWRSKKYIEEEDLRFLDVWRAPPWLVAQPNSEAAEKFRRHMKQKYGHYLRAWRTVMDRDGSNCCNWHEFVDTAKQMKFHGDIAGAWLALDTDLSGFVSIKEIDEDTAKILVEFKSWASEEFGGVGHAFQILDKDHSGELSYKEFRFAVREYGFTGGVKELFEALDQDRAGSLQCKEMAFLDRWVCEDSDGPQGQEVERSRDALPEQASDRPLSEYGTIGPGPGAYDVQSGFGAAPWAPMARHGGAFSFTSRSKMGWLRMAKSVGPAHYNVTPRVAATQGRQKPAWSFGSQRRTATTPVREDCVSPGPGAYEAKLGFEGPQFSLGYRRCLNLHPSQKAGLSHALGLPKAGRDRTYQ